MLKKRVITALWGIPLVVVAIWFDTPLSWFTILAAVAGLLAALEFYELTGVTKVVPLAVFGLIFTFLLVIYPHITYNFNVPIVTLLLTGAVALSLVMLVFLPKKEGLFNRWAWTIGGILYIGWLLSFLVALRLADTQNFPDIGRNFVFLAILTTFGSDTAAYFTGKAIGRHKLAPQISPGKTWEGTLGGIVGAVIISLLFTLPKLFIWTNPVYIQNLSCLQAILLGVLVSIFGQAGDLVESLLKRNLGVKDSGKMMPGHGGILDRIDSILFAGVVVYLYYALAVI